MIRLAQKPGFDKDDAKIVAHILAEFDGSDNKARNAMLVRLKEVYIRNYYGVKNDKNNDEKNKTLKYITVIYKYL